MIRIIRRSETFARSLSERVSKVTHNRPDNQVLQVMTANRLRDGLVVFLTSDGGWHDDIAFARVLKSDTDIQDAAAVSELAVESTHIVAPYLIDNEVREGKAPHPTKYREWLRTQGPSVRLDLGKQVDLPQHAKEAPHVSL